MAQSIVGIANRALQLLGAGAVLNLTDNTLEAVECMRCYDSCRRAELRAHIWNFATARVSLAPDATAPAFGYQYQFSLPVDCVRIVYPNDAELDWKVEGRKILTNSLVSPFGSSPYNGVVVTSGVATLGAQLNLEYIQDVQDPTVFDPCFCEALAARMARAMCERLTQSNQKQQTLAEAYKEAISEARLTDAFESLPQDPPDDDFWLARVR